MDICSIPFPPRFMCIGVTTIVSLSLSVIANHTIVQSPTGRWSGDQSEGDEVKDQQGLRSQLHLRPPSSRQVRLSSSSSSFKPVAWDWMKSEARIQMIRNEVSHSFSPSLIASKRDQFLGFSIFSVRIMWNVRFLENQLQCGPECS